ncbi:DNA primase [Prolixibacteraceae bacterium JC049]|nr:DNA primase [Prolixibacteraceae bacterium JC049]
MIDQATIQRIFDAAEVAEVVGEFVTLKRRGVNLIGHCPFHNEKTPSFIVSPSKGIYKCFGCGKGGNSVNFIMDHEQLSYVEALKYLAKKYNIEVHEKEETPEMLEKRNERESMLIVSGYAQKYFTRILNEDNEGRSIGLSYLRQRGIREDLIKKFELGYCPDKRDAFTKSAQKQGYRMEYLEKTGLTIKREDWVRDRFAARVIFPIHNIAGRVIAFGGRILKDDKKAAKYLNSPESEIYHKSRVLYGMFQAKREITKHDRCFLVEGYTDVISFHQAGIENVVASSGTALTADQIRLIKRFTNNVTIIYDGDAAGIKASLRGIDLVLEEGLNVKVLLLPDGEDPDSFARSMSSTQLLEYIKQNETDFIKFKTKLLLNNTENDPVTRARVIGDIVRSIATIPEPIVRSVYIKECSGLLDVKEEVLYQEIRKIKQKHSEDVQMKQKREAQRAAQEPAPAISIPAQQIPCQEEEGSFMRLMLKFFNNVMTEEEINEHEVEQVRVRDYIISELEADSLKAFNPVYQRILDESVELSDDENFDCQKHFINHPDPDINQAATNLLAEKYVESARWRNSGSYVEDEEDILDYLVTKAIVEYKMARVKMMEKDIFDKMNKLNPKNDAEELNELLAQMMNLKKIETLLSKELGRRAIM